MGYLCWRLHVTTLPLGVFLLGSASIPPTSCAKDRCDSTAGATLELGFLGSVLRLKLPHTVDEQQFLETSSFAEKYDPGKHVRSYVFSFQKRT